MGNIQPQTNKPVILIADIQYLVVEGLKSTLGNRFVLMDTVQSKYELLQAIHRQVPDILFLDYGALDFEGYDDLKDLRSDCPEMHIVITANTISSLEFKEYNACGIKHILLKSAGKEELEECLAAVTRNRKYYSELVLDMVFDSGKELKTWVDNLQLTTSEKEIIALVAGGLTTKEIAEKRSVSHHTIMTHRKNIFRKLGVNNASELVMYAIKTGIIDAIDYQI
ncbi:MAG: response regulator transcription factor [Bacteroidales bacterium]|nr:response regulator transcription factor [Bacteroidales bacterium]